MSVCEAIAEPMTPAAARVERVYAETHDTFTLEAALEEGAAPPFVPGQFSMLYVFGVAELPISISGDPAETGRLTYTVRSVGLATHALVSLREKAYLGIRGPYGAGWPMEAARGKDLVVVAGGIGLAPLRPVLYSIFRHRDEYRRVILLYGARSPRDILYRKQLSRWAREPNTQVMSTVDYGGLSWKGYVGVVTTLFRHVRLDPARTVAMVCGPEVMIEYVAMELASRGLAEADIHVSMERNMKCGTGKCGHCQLGPLFVCKDGPVFPYHRVKPWMHYDEI